jgi:hypothetical protein
MQAAASFSFFPLTGILVETVHCAVLWFVYVCYRLMKQPIAYTHTETSLFSVAAVVMPVYSS